MESIEEFEKWFRDQQEPLGEEFQKVLDDHLWELIEAANQPKEKTNADSV
jgi:hypothetical protein